MITVTTNVELPDSPTLGKLVEFVNAAVSKGVPLDTRIETPDFSSYADDDDWQYVGPLRVQYTVTEPLSTPQDAV